MDRDKREILHERIDKLVMEHKATQKVPQICHGMFHESVWFFIQDGMPIHFCIGCGQSMEEG